MQTANAPSAVEEKREKNRTPKYATSTTEPDSATETYNVIQTHGLPPSLKCPMPVGRRGTTVSHTRRKTRPSPTRFELKCYTRFQQVNTQNVLQQPNMNVHVALYMYMLSYNISGFCSNLELDVLCCLFLHGYCSVFSRLDTLSNFQFLTLKNWLWIMRQRSCPSSYSFKSI